MTRRGASCSRPEIDFVAKNILDTTLCVARVMIDIFFWIHSCEQQQDILLANMQICGHRVDVITQKYFIRGDKRLQHQNSSSNPEPSWKIKSHSHF